MKENKNNQKTQAELVEKNQKPQQIAKQSPSENMSKLQEFAIQTVMEKFPEIEHLELETVNEMFIEHHLDIIDSLKMVEKLVEKFVVHLNSNPMVGKLINQLYNEEATLSQEQAPQNGGQPKREKVIQTISSFCERNRINPEQLEKFQTTLANFVQPISQNDIDDNILETILRVVNIDSEIEENYKKGILDGRNQKIEEQIAQYITTDGLYGNGAANATTTGNSGYIERLLNSRK